MQIHHWTGNCKIILKISWIAYHIHRHTNMKLKTRLESLYLIVQLLSLTQGWPKAISVRSEWQYTIPQICVRAIIPYCHVGSGLYFTQLLITQGCAMTLFLTQCHIFKVKVTLHNTQNPCQDHNSLLSWYIMVHKNAVHDPKVCPRVTWIWMILNTIVVHDPGVVVVGVFFLLGHV